jgi:outer membrane protein TolC
MNRVWHKSDRSIPARLAAGCGPRLRVLLGACLSALTLAGCVRFQPQALSPEQTAGELGSRSLTNAVVRDFLSRNLRRSWSDWPAVDWDFDMLTLAAFYYSPALDVVRADWQVARGGAQTAGGRPNPSVTVTPGYDSTIPGAPSPWIVPVTFDWPIETAGKRRRRIEQAGELSESARFNIATTAWRVRSELRSSLVQFVATRRRAQLIREQLALQKEMEARLASQERAGAVSAAELVPAHVALARLESDLADAQSQVAEARVRLAVAIGVPSSALDSISPRFDLSRVPAAGELTSSEARTAALRNRADILGALAEYAACQSALQLEIARQYPDFHLGPGYAWNAGSAGDSQWSLGITLELPVLNRNEGPIAEAKARRAASAARFVALQARVIGEIDRAAAVYGARRRGRAALQSVLFAQGAQRDRVEEAFKAGAADRLELLGARLEFAAAAAAVLDAEVGLQEAFGALEDAVQRPMDLPYAISRPPREDAH